MSIETPITKPWRTIAQEKQDHRAALLTAAQVELANFSSSIDYTGVPSTKIVRNITTRVPGWTAENVLKAFMLNAIVAHENTNCLTEVMYGEALAEARALDEEFARTGVPRGPLHGLPVSFKDLFQVKGYDACIGFTQWSQKPSTTNTELVVQVRALGGIPFVKTNVPQTLLSFECANPVWGRSSNPWSAKHTCGGSTGGEAALLGCDGSALGFGSDVGGSLRIPTGYCGIYSLKPGVGRFSTIGGRNTTPGFEAIRTVMGPMTRSVGDVELACRALFSKSSTLVEGLPPVPYRDVTLPQKLKFGYYKSDELMKASPPCQRAVQETVDALRAKGHECVEIEVPFIVEALRIFASLTSADGHKTLTSHHGPDPYDPSLFLVTLGPKLPSFLRNFVGWAMQTFKNDHNFSLLFRNSRERTVQEYYAETKKRNMYNELFYAEVWIKHGLDGIIAPVQAIPALPHKTGSTLAPLAIGTILYNVVDSPVGVIPVTRVDAARDTLTLEWEKRGPNGTPFVFDAVYKGRSPVYNAKDMEGLPVGVQVVGKHWEEEKVIEMMKVVDDALGPRDFGPGVWQSAKDS